MYRWLVKYNKYIIFSGTEEKIPNTLQEYITSITLPLPNKKEIKTEIARFIQHTDVNSEINNLQDSLSVAYTGFSINKIRQSISKLIINNISKAEIINEILQDKQEIIQETGILELYSESKQKLEIGGLKNLRYWLKTRQTIFTEKAQAYGIKTPKGLLLVGIQGTGKSLSAKIISAQWQLPLLRLEISNIFGGILGESENKIKRMTQICEQISPCILWIDEIDKIFTEDATSNDSGTTQRVKSIFLTWLSEKKKNVFIVATANTINNLPIEMLRKGRFDEIFFVDLPNFNERIKIFKIHLKKIRPLTWNKYNIYYLSKISKQLSGAEIEQSIINAMYMAFHECKEFTTEDMVKSIQEIIPLAKTEYVKISRLRRWGYSGKIRLA